MTKKSELGLVQIVEVPEVELKRLIYQHRPILRKSGNWSVSLRGGKGKAGKGKVFFILRRPGVDEPIKLI